MKLFNTKTAADDLKITRGAVQKLIERGRLKAQMLGRDYVIQEDDLNAVKDRKRGRPKGSKNKKK